MNNSDRGGHFEDDLGSLSSSSAAERTMSEIKIFSPNPAIEADYNVDESFQDRELSRHGKILGAVFGLAIMGIISASGQIDPAKVNTGKAVVTSNTDSADAVTERRDHFEKLNVAAGADQSGVSGGSVWELGPGLRGKAIEQVLGQNLPQNFPVIDRFENGTATSIKSLNLGAASYQDMGTLDRTLSGYINKVAGYNGTGPQGWAGVIILGNQITSKALDLAIPSAGSAAQQQVINQAIQNAALNGVTLNVIIHP